ncbi:hypothetical protein SAMN05192529_10587 [Arachidicoccus rhizosphaerae]|uniref:Uncharacterized protein n=1 Tax=Arachidicoccus rhizosphaerae TaxID=551991 RepID=A0A1H3XCB8_9BACT|nr:hypothetical protein SAMN05192529_10587 [Arachidicoccus rhizosphaerae]
MIYTQILTNKNKDLYKKRKIYPLGQVTATISLHLFS